MTESTKPKSKQLETINWLAHLGMLLGVYYFFLSDGPGLGGDSWFYLQGALRIGQNLGYTHTYSILSESLQITQFPPLTSILYTPAFSQFGNHYLTGIFLISITLCFSLLTRLISPLLKSPQLTATYSLLICLSPHFLTHMLLAESETIFFPIFFLSLYLFKKEADQCRLSTLVLLILSNNLLLLTRDVGLALVIAQSILILSKPLHKFLFATLSTTSFLTWKLLTYSALSQNTKLQNSPNPIPEITQLLQVISDFFFSLESLLIGTIVLIASTFSLIRLKKQLSIMSKLLILHSALFVLAVYVAKAIGMEVLFIPRNTLPITISLFLIFIEIFSLSSKPRFIHAAAVSLISVLSVTHITAAGNRKLHKEHEWSIQRLQKSRTFNELKKTRYQNTLILTNRPRYFFSLSNVSVLRVCKHDLLEINTSRTPEVKFGESPTMNSVKESARLGKRDFIYYAHVHFREHMCPEAPLLLNEYKKTEIMSDDFATLYQLDL